LIFEEEKRMDLKKEYAVRNKVVKTVELFINRSKKVRREEVSEDKKDKILYNLIGTMKSVDGLGTNLAGNFQNILNITDNHVQNTYTPRGIVEEEDENGNEINHQNMDMSKFSEDNPVNSIIVHKKESVENVMKYDIEKNEIMFTHEENKFDTLHNNEPDFNSIPREGEHKLIFSSDPTITNQTEMVEITKPNKVNEEGEQQITNPFVHTYAGDGDETPSMKNSSNKKVKKKNPNSVQDMLKRERLLQEKKTKKEEKDKGKYIKINNEKPKFSNFEDDDDW
jgi:hypothetical protein